MKMRPLAISLSPNAELDDVFLALKVFLSPVSWHKTESINLLEKWFQNYFKVSKIYFFNSGRSALYSILKSLGIGKEDEVIIQGFTCVAVPDPILWLGAVPIFADVDDSLNINPDSLEKLITAKTKAIIVQHTFGIPAKLKKIKIIAQKYNIRVIEDCAHSIGGKYDSKLLGSFGDASFFSFGRDKIISSVFGGAAFLRNNKLAESKMNSIYSGLPEASNPWIARQLLHPICFFLILPIYNLYLGKLLLFFLLKLGFISKPVFKTELSGGKPDFFPAKLPGALAKLALNQVNKIELFNDKRREISKIYFRKFENNPAITNPPELKDAVYLRFNILINNRDDVYNKMKRHYILLGKWYSRVIDPQGVNFNKINFRSGSVPNAEVKARLSLNLPTYPLMDQKDAVKIADLINEYADKSNNR